MIHFLYIGGSRGYRYRSKINLGLHISLILTSSLSIQDYLTSKLYFIEDDSKLGWDAGPTLSYVQCGNSLSLLRYPALHKKFVFRDNIF